jgi:hypothetical protein
MTIPAVAAAEIERTAPGVRPYPPSWADWIVRLVEAAPGPIWAAYVVLAGVSLAVVALESALSSRGLFGQDPAYFAYAIFHVGSLASYHFLSRGGRSAWDAFRPAADVDDITSARRRAELSTTPAGPAAVVYVVAVLAYLALLAWSPEGFDLVGHSLAFVLVRVVAEAFWLAPVSFMVGYLLVRQIRIVSRLHRSVVTVDLLEPGPLHAMARLTARSAIVLIALQLLVFVPLPNLTPEARLALILFFLPFLGLSVAAFFLPLRGMHDRLDQERSRLVSAVNGRIRATMESLHQVVDDQTGAGERDADATRLAQVRIDALNKALASLLQERDFIGKLSTWPWDTSTFRAVISAVALPILLFVVTTLIGRFVL